LNPLECELELTTTISPDEVREALKLNRNWRYWLRLFGANWYATALLIVILGAIIVRLVEGKGLQLNSVMILLIPIAFLGFSYGRQQNYIEKTARSLSDPGGIATLESDGIHSKSSSGATSFTPWSVFLGWKEGLNVFTLDTDNNFRVLPKRGLSDPELAQARSLFESQIS
jgi:hypothetical protein